MLQFNIRAITRISREYNKSIVKLHYADQSPICSRFVVQLIGDQWSLSLTARQIKSVSFESRAYCLNEQRQVAVPPPSDVTNSPYLIFLNLPIQRRVSIDLNDAAFRETLQKFDLGLVYCYHQCPAVCSTDSMAVQLGNQAAVA